MTVKFVFALMVAVSLFSGCGADPGEKVYTSNGCPQCHGPDGSGTGKGPPLRDLLALWTEQSLQTYLRGPSAYIKQDTRLQALKEQYKTVMPQFAMTDADRQKLVAYLLSKD